MKSPQCPGNQPWLTCAPHLTYLGKQSQTYGCTRCGEYLPKEDLRENTIPLSAAELELAQLRTRVAELEAPDA